jgi:hypothetical protein
MQLAAQAGLAAFLIRAFRVDSRLKLASDLEFINIHLRQFLVCYYYSE